jgi:hypothetical protein
VRSGFITVRVWRNDVQLTERQRSDWQRTGWLVLPRSLAASTVAEITHWVDEVEASAQSGTGLHHFEQTDDGPAIARSEDFDGWHAGLQAFMRTGVISEILHELFGEPAVLFKEKINYKHPGGAGFAPHQDATAYRFASHHISVMVPIDPATLESGCLWFALGHDRGVIEHEAGRIDDRWVAGATWIPVETGPGDLVFFDSYAPHRSETNRSQRSRRALYLTYNAASDGDHRDRYYADKRRELAGTPSGERVRISINDDFLGRPVDPGDDPVTSGGVTSPEPD